MHQVTCSGGSHRNNTQNYGPLQAVNAAVLMRGFVPNEALEDVKETLHSLVLDADMHTTAGFVGCRYVYAALTLAGHRSDALQVALSTSLPSYGYQVAQGATTLWENWSGAPDDTNGNAAPSHNHHFLGGIGQWFYQALAGLQLQPLDFGAGNGSRLPEDDARAWGRFLVRPEITDAPTLAGMSASLRTRRGLVSVHWANMTTLARDCGEGRLPAASAASAPGLLSCSLLGSTAGAASFTLAVAVPVNAAADIALPCVAADGGRVQANAAVVWRNGAFVAGGSEGVTAGRLETTRAHGCRVVLSVVSGAYDFEAAADGR